MADIALVPTASAFSSTKNLGLWFGAALAGSSPSGVTPRKIYSRGLPWQNRRSLPKHPVRILEPRLLPPRVLALEASG
ncbi:hypothetical protein [Dyadobacter sp. CY343]|uniref:hypothetical protein n=1 Tax=Dyadobacter sp. CY343 TaxID=2907299 RepID=UPI001F2A1521|nr:hypothetical protein [Dyadobacter sp. CY343]MCE7063383.1 hypothetical protein [Dyadobacter sp. CY343]